jgi:hypothetical protein
MSADIRTILRGEQRSDEWFAQRLGCATGSGFAAVLSKPKKGSDTAESTGRRNYRISRALEIVTGVPEVVDLSYSRDVQNGVERESAARLAFEQDSGLLVEEVSFVRLNAQRVGCSPDGLIGENAGLEIKCPNKATHFEYLSLEDDAPAEYRAQVQGCMYVTGRSHWYFASYHPEYPPELQLHWTCVERDQKYIAELEAALAKFSVDVADTVNTLNRMAIERRPPC